MPINRTPLDDAPSKPEKVAKNPMDFALSDPKYTFDDVILPPHVLEEIQNVIALSQHKTLIYETWGLGDVLKRGRNISINLYGDSGTGKTMTAHAIAHTLHKQILFLKYSEIESKYVGETSKNLVRLFDSAMAQDAVIVFDEADALLSKRVTSMHNATDVSVNQTRNVLLQLLDSYTGTVIFTTNFIHNFDFAFMRRILSHIKFESPNEDARKLLWAHYLVEQLPLNGNRQDWIDDVAKIEKLTGSDISTIVLKAALKAAQNGTFAVDKASLDGEIQRIQKAKEAITADEFTVTSKKVSEEYVREKLTNGGTIGGTVQ